jgi:hypothetical protein
MSLELHDSVTIGEVGSSLVSSACSSCHTAFTELVYALFVCKDLHSLFHKSVGWTRILLGSETEVAEKCHHNVSQYAQNAAEGCSICGLLSDFIQAHLPDVVHRNATFFLSSRGDRLIGVHPHSLNLGETSSDIPSINLLDSIEARNQTLLGSTGSSVAFKRIGSWRKECIQDHPRCSWSLERLPDRVIDVQNRNPILVDSGGQRGSWAALSHCWGGKVDLQTNRQNLAAHCRGIPRESFPKTFRDAVDVCRNVGIQYLWIDSICIVQDDPQDWNVQAQQMGRIYGNASFVIAAKSARNSSIGLFRKQSVRLTSSNCSPLFLRDIFIKLPTFTCGRPVLDGRGWCFQEYALAKATLYFWGAFVGWQCSNGTQSDDIEVDVQPMTRLAYIRRSLAPGSDRNQTLWPTIVQEFSQRKLTFDRDKLTAVAGIANRLQQAGFHSGKYIAGLFGDDLLFQLCWYTDRSDVPSTNLLEQFPSWSWASCAGTVHWLSTTQKDELDRCKRHKCCEVQFIEKAPTADQLHSLQQPIGLIELRGRATTLGPCPKDNKLLALFMTDTFLHSKALPPEDNGREQISVKASCYLDHIPSPLSDLWALELVNYEGTILRYGDVSFDWSILLILEEVGDPAMRIPRFRRIGLCIYNGSLNSDTWSEKSIALV